jgi:hypothetical protein
VIGSRTLLEQFLFNSQAADVIEILKLKESAGSLAGCTKPPQQKTDHGDANRLNIAIDTC